MQALLRHDEVVFDDQTIYATGHAYFRCEFHRCTIVVKGFPLSFDTCQFHGCVWHVDFVLHDQAQCGEFVKLIQDVFVRSMPKIELPNGESPPPQPK